MYEIFEALLKEHGLNVAQFSRETGIAKSTLSEWKSGKLKAPRPDRLRQISDFFGVSVDYLMTGEEEKKEHVDPFVASVVENSNDEAFRELVVLAINSDEEKRRRLLAYARFLASGGDV